MTRQQSARVVALGRGFSLLEVLLALALTSMLALLTYTSMTAASAAVQQGELQTRLIDQVDFAWMLLQRDLQHALPGVGLPGTSAATAGNELLLEGEQLGFRGSNQSLGLTGTLLLRLVRDSGQGVLLQLPQQSRQAPHGGLQLVSYLWHDGNLYRRHDDFFEGMQEPDLAASAEHSRQQLLLQDVEQLALEFLPAGAEDLEADSWQLSWPGDGDSSAAVPVAVRVQLTLAGMGQLTRLFVLPVGWGAQ